MMIEKPKNAPHWFTPGIVCEVSDDGFKWRKPRAIVWVDGGYFLDEYGSYWTNARPVKKPKMRPRTRDEALGLMVNTPGAVIRPKKTGSVWGAPFAVISPEKWQWAIMDKNGKIIGEPHDFEIEEDGNGTD
jgi:hypothetical protein